MRRDAFAALALALALGLAGCRSPQQRAAAAAQRADNYAAGGALQMAQLEMMRAVRLDEDEPAYWLSLARYNMRLGDVRGCYTAYQHVYELQRDNVEALEWLAELSVSGGRTDDAQTYLDALMVLQPNDPRGRVVQGEIALRSDHPDRALAAADAVLADDPHAGDAALLKASALEKMGHPDTAAAALEAQITGRNDPRQLLERLVELYSEAGDEAALERTYGRLLQIAPKDPEVALGYARALAASGQKGAALRAVGDIEARHADNSAAALGAIALLHDLSGQAAARAEAQRLAAAHPALRGPLALYLLDDGDAEAARQVAAPAVEGHAVGAGNVDAEIAYAGALRAGGQRGQARAVLDRVIAFDQTNVRALLMRTEIELDEQNRDRALADVRVAVEANPQSEGAQLLLARVYAESGNDLLARGAYATAMNTLPGNERVLGAFVDYLLGRQALGQAMAVTDSFTRAYPRSAEGWARRREACAAAGDLGCVRQAAAVLGTSGGRFTKQEPGGKIAA